jgi:hypothetical protein
MQAQPPTALRILRWTSEKLNQKRAELLDRAFESLTRKKRAQYGIPRYARIKCHREFAAIRRTAEGII